MTNLLPRCLQHNQQGVQGIRGAHLLNLLLQQVDATVQGSA